MFLELFCCQQGSTVPWHCPDDNHDDCDVLHTSLSSVECITILIVLSQRELLKHAKSLMSFSLLLYNNNVLHCPYASTKDSGIIRYQLPNVSKALLIKLPLENSQMQHYQYWQHPEHYQRVPKRGCMCSKGRYVQKRRTTITCRMPYTAPKVVCRSSRSCRKGNPFACVFNFPRALFHLHTCDNDYQSF